MVKILVFDTETTGLPLLPIFKDYNARTVFESSLLSQAGLTGSWPTVLDSWPSIIQLSYILYDTENPELSKIFDKYIDLPEGIIITEGSSDIHHITRETIKAQPEEKKATIKVALDEFLADVATADILVGHNVNFDRRMVIAEILRENKKPDTTPMDTTSMTDNSKYICTMVNSTKICGLPFTYIDKKTGEKKTFEGKLKSPKLSEAYYHFFGYEPTDLHNSLYDVVITLRVYGMLQTPKINVCNNTKITKLITDIAPSGIGCGIVSSSAAVLTSEPGGGVGGYKKRKTKKSKKTKKRKYKKARKTTKKRKYRR
jgi:DNA polymerase III epsilon subunit-like protein